MQGKLKVGEINVRQAIGVANSSILYEKCYPNTYGKAFNESLTIRLLGNIRLNNPDIVWISRG